MGNEGPRDGCRWHPEEGTALREDALLRPGDIYCWTMVAGEELCKLYGRRHGIPSVALRYGAFVPEPFFRFGIRLLYGGVDTHDVARSVMASMEALMCGHRRWDPFNVESVVPFTEEDGPQLGSDPLPVLDKHYPGASLLRERGGGDPRADRGVLPNGPRGGRAWLQTDVQLRPVAGGVAEPAGGAGREEPALAVSGENRPASEGADDDEESIREA
ncbi:MAG: hypothetical protein M3Q03_11480 [Chloroflexota bacterium]|nr:hypothetical protein [Chloroflexota bacterium]